MCVAEGASESTTQLFFEIARLIHASMNDIDIEVLKTLGVLNN